MILIIWAYRCAPTYGTAVCNLQGSILVHFWLDSVSTGQRPGVTFSVSPFDHGFLEGLILLQIRLNVFGVPSAVRRRAGAVAHLSLSDLPRVPIGERYKRGPVGLRYQPKLESPWDMERLQTTARQTTRRAGALPQGRHSGFIRNPNET